MISVSDARKGLGLSLDGGAAGGRADIEESELEEGEACSYQNNQDFDPSIDPGVALSYFKMLFKPQSDGLFKGNGANCAQIVPNSAVKFFSYEQASKG